jgi:hypothetical protein
LNGAKDALRPLAAYPLSDCGRPEAEISESIRLPLVLPKASQVRWRLNNREPPVDLILRPSTPSDGSTIEADVAENGIIGDEPPWPTFRLPWFNGSNRAGSKSCLPKLFRRAQPWQVSDPVTRRRHAESNPLGQHTPAFGGAGSETRSRIADKVLHEDSTLRHDECRARWRPRSAPKIVRDRKAFASSSAASSAPTGRKTGTSGEACSRDHYPVTGGCPNGLGAQLAAHRSQFTSPLASREPIA